MDITRISEVSNIRYNEVDETTTYTQTRYDIREDGSRHVLNQGDVTVGGLLDIQGVLSSEESRVIPEEIDSIVFSDETTPA